MRYFFHLRAGQSLIKDHDGDDLSSLEEVRREAIISARHLMADRLRSGRPLGKDSFEIHDAQGNLMLTVSFNEAIPVE